MLWLVTILVIAIAAWIGTGSPAAGVALGFVAYAIHTRLTRLEQRLGRVEDALGILTESEAAGQVEPTMAEAEPAAAPEAFPEAPAAPPPYWASASATEPAMAVEAMAVRPTAPARAKRLPPAWVTAITDASAQWRHASLAELEELVAGRLLAVVGGIALILGGVFFLGLAFSRGWIGPELRVVIGLVVGVVVFALGGWLLRGRRQIVAHVLVAVGIAVYTLAFFAATRLYGFIGAELGVGAALLAAAAAAALAVRFDAPVIAAFGLVAVIGSPPVMGASASLVTLAFLGAALVGTTAIAVFRSWRWLPPLAFVLAAPQLWSYAADSPSVGLAVGAIGVFWAFNATAAAGDELHRRQDRLSLTSAGFLIVAAAYTVAVGFELLSGSLERWQGVFLLALALAHFGVAAIFLVREGDRHPFGMLAAGTGIAAVTLAVPIQLGAEWVPLAWAAEGVVLTWIHVERRHPYSGIAAAVLGILAAGHILAVEYPPNLLAEPAAGAVPFVNSSGLSLGFVLLAAAIGTWLLRRRSEGIAVAAVATALVAVAVPHELSGWAASSLLTLLVAGSIIVSRRFLAVPLRLDGPDLLPGGNGPLWATFNLFAERALYGAAAVSALVLAAAFFDSVPVADVRDGLASTALPSGTPFLDEATAVAFVTAVGAAVVAGACRGAWRPAGLLVVTAIVAYLLPSQVGGAIAVVGWAALAVALSAGVRIGEPLAWGAKALAGAAAVQTLFVVAPVDRLWVRAAGIDEMAVLNGAVLAVVAVAAMLAARGYLPPVDRERRWARYAAAGVAVYAASISVVDLFQLQVGGPIALEELEKQAQVALSVLWAVIGSVATVAGLRLARAPLRLAGLALLGIVTLKVFVVDLAALDIAYRVLSFAALGVLLLVAAYLYGRMQPHAVAGHSLAHH